MNEPNLPGIARETLKRYGFQVDPPASALEQAEALGEPDFKSAGVKDLSGCLWSSIDNNDSRDLDQIEFLQPEKDGVRLWVGIADVAAFVPTGSALDQAAWTNTTSLYTGLRNFPLFPERLSTNLTSLLEGQKRLALVVDMVFDGEGKMTESTLYRAVVQNQAQLTYAATGAWLENQPPDNNPVSQCVLQKIQSNPDLQDQLRRQRALSELLRRRRMEAGALTFETIQLRPTLLPDGRWDLQAGTPNHASRLIEDFMIAANQATVAFLQARGFPSLRRIVRTPKNWLRIVELAARCGTTLPGEPDAKLLEAFLQEQRRKDPDHFPDLSLSVIKLLGRGEYAVASASGDAPGHFSLAVEGYAHSTAPNRRYPDLITQRLLRAALSGEKQPYSNPELADLAAHCTQKEDDANKAERSINKSLAAAAMAHQVGQTFEGFLTGVSDKGVWVRLLRPPVEGRVEGSVRGLAVGDRVIVKLVLTDPWHGYIDFTLVKRL